MARTNYRIAFEQHAATLTFSRPIDALDFQATLYTEQSGSWPFVIKSINCGVDWPVWWRRYERQRNHYLALLNGAPRMNALPLGKKDSKAEMWRRYELCSRAGIATCENVHYPDFFEIEEIVYPCTLDETRESFPKDTFAQYIMACPPKDRLLDPKNPGVLNEVWAEQQDFFIANGLLVPWSKIPSEVIATAASNQNLRMVITRCGGKTHSARAINERTFLDIAKTEQGATDTLRELSIAKEQWCRMPPQGLSWEQLQAYRWLARGLGGSLLDMFTGFGNTALDCPE